MEKERKVKIISLITLIVAVLGLTVAFAALSQTLTINGTANVNAASWDIHFESLDGNNQIQGINELINEPAGEFFATLSEDKKIINYFGIVLAPGDSVNYEFKIVNKGTIDASIGSINISTPNYSYTTLTDCSEGYDSEYAHCEDGIPFVILNKEVSKDTLDLLKKYYTVKLYYKDTNQEVKPGDKLAKGEEKNVVLKTAYDAAAPSSLNLNEYEGNGEFTSYYLLSHNQELTINYVQD